MNTSPQTVVVIGNGMVGHRFVEKLVEFDTLEQYKIVTFCEEPRAAYDRVGLTSFFAHRDAEQLMLARLDWYRENGVELHIGDRACTIDRDKKLVRSEAGVEITYDHIVMATGSYPFVPPVEGFKLRGVFVYRTIEDLERIIEFGKKSKRCAVIGGGLLGLEAAKAAYDLGLETHVIEFAPRLMPRQIDDHGSQILVKRIEEMGVRVHLNKGTKVVLGNGQVEKMVFNNDEELDVDMIIVSCGVRPRDDLARESGLELGERGGVLVNDALQTSDPDIYAVGEVAQHSGMVYGLVAPGYEMAEILAMNLTGSEARFTGADLSTKLKLMGVDVASFGQNELPADQATPLVYEDPIGGVYKKLLFDPAGKNLLGGILVGDASDYGTLSILAKSGDPLPCQPGDLLGGSGGGAAAALGGADAMSDDAQICSCNNVTKGAICAAITEGGLTSLTDLKSCTKAGTGCGGCMPLVADVFKAQLEKSGVEVNNNLCEHFAYSRQELFGIVKVKEIKTFAELITSYGSGNGCEICKPAVGSILASLWNDTIINADHQTLQDTNDRFLANMQRGGLYSVVPRVPGGEITPDKLIVIGNVAKKYGLYTKITGGQRIDLFGAQLHQLPDIWEELIDAGFESGHAYGKAVRTVKSCVGTSWCRYGVQDSVRFAIEVEKRYRGIRAPHKIKFAVSGCVRECAEAQCKDVGLIATENGYNLYVCGNGGAKPRHADLFATDIDEQTALKYIDRFLMYYIYTADKLMRTATWVEQLDGGLDHVKDVVIHDKLGLCDELEERMQHLVDTYQCEWKAVVDDPEKRKLYRQFINTEEHERDIEFVDERGQQRPVYWPKDGDLVQIQSSPVKHEANGTSKRPPAPKPEWIEVGNVADFPRDGGAAIKYGDVQIAVFNFSSRGEWYACQNMCPHKNAFVLSRGILGSVGEEPKVACPLHKKPFSLKSGESLSGEDFSVKVFPIKVEAGKVLVELPPKQQLDALLATRLHIIGEELDACSACTGHKEEEITQSV
ncbi:nitrite reductase large subunit NirB [Bythopirellula goksoeyrii]|uniref:Nitrite reductase [NAD(P)H] n=1 Tax=Bythopirellula goksoeyrii TaxID=1400387 RepID=A0A5B9QI18_9BACT|nr:nitrite reductase large subunit NirB [Bythopirellula goksoeyrii]QEG37230.1 Nitrite reductase [NAD(P)H] [Bythopirellula goksoeyrii]